MHKQTGVSLLEILVTIAVLSFGLLALASLQIKTMGYLNNSSQHYMVMAIAETVAEGVRASSRPVSTFEGFKLCVRAEESCVENLAGLGEIAQEWKDQIEGKSVETLILEVLINSSNDKVTIVVQWKENRSVASYVNEQDFSSYQLQVLL